MNYVTVKNLRHFQQKPARPPSSALTSIALAVIPLLLIALVLGFIARCVVDYIHAHIEQEVGKWFSEMELWQARRRPRVNLWHTILDEDRDEDELKPGSISEYQYQASLYIHTLSSFDFCCS